MQFLSGLRLSNRALLKVEGPDAALFLQGLITKDIRSVSETSIAYALLLNVKGRIKFDLLLYKHHSDSFILETDSTGLLNLEKALNLYRLKRKVDFTQLSSKNVYFVQSPNKTSITNKDVFEDPRASGYGYRHLNDARDLKFNNEMSMDDYLKRRLQWGIPEGLDELDDQIPMNMNADIMNGISYEKGCYIGQELVARTHHTGIIRRRIMPFHSDGDCIKGGTLIDENNNKQARIIKSHGSIGIALVVVNQLGQKLFDKNGTLVNLNRPKWWPLDL